MWPTITPSTKLSDQLVDTMVDLCRRAGNLHSHRGDAFVFQYYDWVDDAVRRLAAFLSTDDVDRLIRTRVYWQVTDIPANQMHVQQIVRGEIESVTRRLEALCTEFRAAADYWDETANYVVLDTNIFVEHHTRFDQTDWFEAVNHRPSLSIRLVVPQIVLDELDDLKTRLWRDRGKDSRPWRIAQVLKTLEEAAAMQPLSLPECRHLGHGHVTVETLPDPLMHRRLDVNDAEIVRRATDLQGLTGREVTLVSNDTGMLVRARLAGLRPVRLVPIETKAAES